MGSKNNILSRQKNYFCLRNRNSIQQTDDSLPDTFLGKKLELLKFG